MDLQFIDRDDEVKALNNLLQKTSRNTIYATHGRLDEIYEYIDQHLKE